MKIVYNSKCLEFSRSGHPESPERVAKAADFLKEKGYEFMEPEKCRKEDILEVHSQELVRKVEEGNFRSMDCPAYEDIYEYARLSVGGAIKAAEVNGFSLMRPPGHHATRERLGGFCYFNNIAVAVEKLDKRVLIVDIDRHHGNGTQDIFLGEENVEYVSLHGSGFPGTGRESEQNCHNHLFTSTVKDEGYLEVLDRMLSLDKEFDILAVSAGFDTYKEDPLASKIQLTTQSYRSIGQRLAELEIPVLSVLEGGYNSQKLGENIHSFLRGLEN